MRRPFGPLGGWPEEEGEAKGEREGSSRDDGSLDRKRSNSVLISVQLVRFHRKQVVIENQRSS